MIGGGLHLVEQVTRQQHRAAMGGEVAQERSHPGDALGIEPVRRFIEDQRPRFTDEGLGDAEALAHAKGVGPHPLILPSADSCTDAPTIATSIDERAQARPARLLAQAKLSVTLVSARRYT